MTQGAARGGTGRRRAGWALFAAGVLILGAMFLLLRLGVTTDFLYHSLVKDPERRIPDGNVIVAPADGRVLYVKRVRDGVIPQVVKKGVAVPIVEHLKTEPSPPFASGYLVGIFMNSHGVHVNRVPTHATVKARFVFHGPHMDMTEAEREVILRQLVPGMVSARKLLGLEPFDLENRADYVLRSARETLLLEDERGARLYVVRIADYWVGKILTWVSEGDRVQRGQKLGMITYGSQTDLFIEDTPGMAVRVEPGDYVYGGETVVATY